LGEENKALGYIQGDNQEILEVNIMSNLLKKWANGEYVNFNLRS
jgi:hypothetical protein